MRSAVFYAGINPALMLLLVFIHTVFDRFAEVWTFQSH